MDMSQWGALCSSGTDTVSLVIISILSVSWGAIRERSIRCKYLGILLSGKRSICNKKGFPSVFLCAQCVSVSSAENMVQTLQIHTPWHKFSHDQHDAGTNSGSEEGRERERNRRNSKNRRLEIELDERRLSPAWRTEHL